MIEFTMHNAVMVLQFFGSSIYDRERFAECSYFT